MPQETRRNEPTTLRPYADLCARGLEHALLDLAAHRAPATRPLFDDLDEVLAPAHPAPRRRQAS
jgi:hypothetical protein